MARKKQTEIKQVDAREDVEVLSFAEQVEECFLEMYDRYDVANAPEKRKNEIIDSFWTDIYKQVFKPDKPQLNNCKSLMMVYDVENVQEVVEMYINLCKRFGGVIKYNQFANLTGIHRDTLYRWHKYNTSGKYVFDLNDSQYTEDSSTTMYVTINNSVVEYKSNDIFNGNTDNTSIDIIHNDIRDNDNNIYNSAGVYIDNLYNNSTMNGNKERELLSRKRYDVIKKLQEEMQDSNTNQLSNDTMGAAIRANNEEELGKLYEPKRMIQHEQIKQALGVNDLPKLSDNITPKALPTLTDGNI